MDGWMDGWKEGRKQAKKVVKKGRDGGNAYGRLIDSGRKKKAKEQLKPETAE